MTPRIAIWAGSSLPNAGDRLLAAVTEAELARRLPAARFRHFCPWSTADAPAPLWVDRKGRWPGAGSFDAIVMAGGVWSGPPFRHPIMQVFCLGPEPRLFDPGAWVAWHGVGLQDGTPPPDRDEWRAHLTSVKERLDHLTVRGAQAAARMGGARIVPDPSFALSPLPAPARPRRRRPLIGVAVGAPGVTSRLITRLVGGGLADRCPPDPALCLPPAQVAAAMSDPGAQAARLGFVTELGLTLIALAGRADLEFITVPNIYGDDETGARLARPIRGARVRELKSADAGELTAAMAGCDLVLVSRYHSAVLALRAGIPFVAVDPFWSPENGTSKLHELTTQLGMEHRYWTYRQGDACADLLQIVERALDGDPARTTEVYQAMHIAAAAAFDRLADGIRAATAARAISGRAS